MTPLNGFFAVISVNQPSVYGAVAGLCRELARNSRGTEKPAANENLESMAIPTEFPTTNPLSQTRTDVQGNLLREYKQKFAELPEHDKLTKVCSNACFSENIEKRQCFITPNYDALKKIYERIMSSVYPSPRKFLESSHVREWTRGNTKIVPVLDVNVCYHQGRYGVEIMIESLFRDRTVSWGRIVDGINKHVTETSEEILSASVGHRGTRKPVANAKTTTDTNLDVVS